MGIIKAFFKGFQAGAPIKQPRPKLTRKEAYSLGLVLRQTMAANWAEKKATIKENIKGNIAGLGSKSGSIGKNVISNLKANAVNMVKSNQAPMFPTMKAPKFRPPRLF